MIKGTFSQNANIGEAFEPQYRFQVSKEHASQLYRVLRETHLKPADWLARVIVEELERIGYRVEIPDPGDLKGQLTIEDRIQSGNDNGKDPGGSAGG